MSWELSRNILKAQVFKRVVWIPSLLWKIPSHFWSFLKTPKWLTVSKENIKADGSDSLNTKKQVLSKSEAFASLPALLAPASTSCLRPPHICSLVPMWYIQLAQRMKSNNLQIQRLLWDLLFKNAISFSLQVPLF